MRTVWVFFSAAFGYNSYFILLQNPPFCQLTIWTKHNFARRVSLQFKYYMIKLKFVFLTALHLFFSSLLWNSAKRVPEQHSFQQRTGSSWGESNSAPSRGALHHDTWKQWRDSHINPWKVVLLQRCPCLHRFQPWVAAAVSLFHSIQVFSMTYPCLPICLSTPDHAAVLKHVHTHNFANFPLLYTRQPLMCYPSLPVTSVCFKISSKLANKKVTRFYRMHRDLFYLVLLDR